MSEMSPEETEARVRAISAVHEEVRKRLKAAGFGSPEANVLLVGMVAALCEYIWVVRPPGTDAKDTLEFWAQLGADYLSMVEMESSVAGVVGSMETH